MTTTLTRDQAIGVIGRRGLKNPTHVFDAAELEDTDLAGACALMEKETHGANVYGNDEGGMLSGFPLAPNEDNFQAYWFMVSVRGAVPNGVGPSQITSAGLITVMINDGLKPWDVLDNMCFGFRLIRMYRQSLGNWHDAAVRYNGSNEYGDDFVLKRERWKIWLKYEGTF